MDGFYYEFNTNFKGTVYICNNRTLFSWNTYITHNKLGTY